MWEIRHLDGQQDDIRLIFYSLCLKQTQTIWVTNTTWHALIITKIYTIILSTRSYLTLIPITTYDSILNYVTIHITLLYI